MKAINSYKYWKNISSLVGTSFNKIFEGSDPGLPKWTYYAKDFCARSDNGLIYFVTADLTVSEVEEGTDLLEIQFAGVKFKDLKPFGGNWVLYCKKEDPRYLFEAENKIINRKVKEYQPVGVDEGGGVLWFRKSSGDNSIYQAIKNKVGDFKVTYSKNNEIDGNTLNWYHEKVQPKLGTSSQMKTVIYNKLDDRGNLEEARKLLNAEIKKVLTVKEIIIKHAGQSIFENFNNIPRDSQLIFEQGPKGNGQIPKDSPYGDRTGMTKKQFISIPLTTKIDGKKRELEYQVRELETNALGQLPPGWKAMQRWNIERIVYSKNTDLDFKYDPWWKDPVLSFLNDENYKGSGLVRRKSDFTRQVGTLDDKIYYVLEQVLDPVLIKYDKKRGKVLVRLLRGAMGIIGSTVDYVVEPMSEKTFKTRRAENKDINDLLDYMNEEFGEYGEVKGVKAGYSKRKHVLTKEGAIDFRNKKDDVVERYGEKTYEKWYNLVKNYDPQWIQSEAARKKREKEAAAQRREANKSTSDRFFDGIQKVLNTAVVNPAIWTAEKAVQGYEWTEKKINRVIDITGDMIEDEVVYLAKKDVNLAFKPVGIFLKVEPIIVDIGAINNPSQEKTYGTIDCSAEARLTIKLKTKAKKAQGPSGTIKLNISFKYELDAGADGGSIKITGVDKISVNSDWIDSVILPLKFKMYENEFMIKYIKDPEKNEGDDWWELYDMTKNAIRSWVYKHDLKNTFTKEINGLISTNKKNLTKNIKDIIK